jgi:hypothetical protein
MTRPRRTTVSLPRYGVFFSFVILLSVLLIPAASPSPSASGTGGPLPVSHPGRKLAPTGRTEALGSVPHAAPAHQAPGRWLPGGWGAYPQPRWGPLGTSPPDTVRFSSRPSAGTVSLPYSTAASRMINASAGYDGVVWNVSEGYGYRSSWPLVSPLASFTNPTQFGCVLSWIGPAPSNVTFPATPSSATSGTAAAYEFLLTSEGAPSIVLEGGVLNGTAALWFTLSGYQCANNLGPTAGEATPPASALDSPRAVSVADQAGGSQFLRAYPDALREWVLFGPQGAVGTDGVAVSNPAIWGLFYESPGCFAATGGAGAEFEAVVDATTGALFTNRTILCSPSYAVNFTETGLPPGTSWSVVLSNQTTAWTNQSTGSSIGFGWWNGTGSYAVPDLSGYVPSPASGTVTVNGANQTVSISFSSATTDPVTFRETGLLAGAAWAVTLGPTEVFSNASAITFEAVNGSYSYSVVSPLYYSVTSTGSVNVSGPVNVTVTYRPWTDYTVQVTETGLPAGTPWDAVLDAYSNSGTSGNWGFYLENASTSSTIDLTMPNGTYNFGVGSVSPFYGPTPLGGTLTVSGNSTVLSITFAARAAYLLTFRETGLPAGTPWFTEAAGFAINSSTSPSLNFTLPNGSVSFLAGGAPGYQATPASGTLTIAGAPVAQTISFGPLSPPPAYSVYFNESGLVGGTSWSVTLGGATRTSVGPSVIFNESNGSYLFSIGSIPGLIASPSGGSVLVNGSPLGTLIAFRSASSPSYSVLFEETGLPSSTRWSVTLASSTSFSTAPSLSFSEPNATYPYSVGGVAGYVAAPSSGSVTVAGNPAPTVITFSPVPPPPPSSYAVVFQESGLANATHWTVTLAGSPLASNRSSLTFLELNGVYAFSVGPVPGYTATPSSGTVRVSATNQTVPVSFATGGNGATPSSSSGGILGLPGPVGYVVVGGAVVAVAVGIAIAAHSYAPISAAGITGGAAARRARRRRKKAGPGGWGPRGSPAPAATSTPPGESPPTVPVSPSPPASPAPAALGGVPPPAPAQPASAATGATSAVAEAAFCTVCGHPFAGSQHFCTSCGRPR